MKKPEFKEEDLLKAKERLKGTEYAKIAKDDLDELFRFVRPEYMIDTDVFKKKCNEKFEKHIEISKDPKYDKFESKVIFNTANTFIEFLLKAFLTMCYYN